MGWPPHDLAFDVALRAGTLVAVLAAFSSEWLRIFRSAADGVRQGRPLRSEGVRLLLLLSVASIPAGVAGLLLEERAETGFRDPRLVAVAMGLMGVVLYLADRWQPRGPGAGPDGILQVSWRDGPIIGVAQALALVPGVSRSGATIGMALLLGFSRGYVRTNDYRPFAAYRVGFAVFVLTVVAVRGA